MKATCVVSPAVEGRRQHCTMVSVLCRLCYVIQNHVLHRNCWFHQPSLFSCCALACHVMASRTRYILTSCVKVSCLSVYPPFVPDQKARLAHCWARCQLLLQAALVPLAESSLTWPWSACSHICRVCSMRQSRVCMHGHLGTQLHAKSHTRVMSTQAMNPESSCEGERAATTAACYCWFEFPTHDVR